MPLFQRTDRSFELRSALSETQRLVSLSLQFVVCTLVQRRWRFAVCVLLVLLARKLDLQA